MENKEKMHKHGWKRGFVRMTSMLMLCFNMISAPLTIICTATIAVATITLVVSCDKEQPEPTQNTHNIEYIYDISFKFHRVNDTALITSSAFIDTVAKHGADTRVKRVLIKPDYENMWSTAQEAQMELRTKKFRNMYNASNNKLSGENTTLELDAAAFNNSNVQNVLHDTLRINLVQR